jgi:hypothetical protein
VDRPFIATVQFTGPFKIYGNLFRIKAEGRKAIVAGELVTPVAVQASSSPDQVGINRAFDGSGLRDQDNDGLLEHSSKLADMWLTEKGQTTGWIEFDLGKAHKLDLIQIWNFNEKWHTNRGLKKADISIWTEGVGWQKVLDDFQVDEADGSDDYDEPALAKLGGVQAQKIRFDDLTNLGDAEYVGLSEVRFFEVLGPAAVRPQPADGAKGVGLSGLTLNWTPGSGAVAHNLYFGTEPNNLELLGKVEDASTARLSRLAGDTKYYWRVDEVQADRSSAKSKVWSFQTGGLLAWWKFDETEGSNVSDSSGNSYAGTLVGEPQWQPSGGKIGGALQLDGKDDYVEITKNANFDLTDQITVMAWIKVNAFDKAWQSIVTKGDNSWRMQRSGQRNTLLFGCTGVSNNVWGNVMGKTDVNDGSWHHVAGVYDGKKICLYVDGKLDVSSEGSGYINKNDWPVLIGENAQRTERQWNGLIDDVRIYDCSFSETEVAALYSDKALPVVAKVTLEMPAPKAAVETPTGSGQIKTLTADTEKPSRGKNWIPVLIIVAIVGLAVGFATLRKKGPA